MIDHRINVVAFDADDTLWENENHYQQVETRFCELLSNFGSKEEVSQQLFKTEIKNLPIYGYGVKAMTLSMIETACKISGKMGSIDMVNNIIQMGRELLQHPVILLDGVKEVLEQLSKTHRLVLATKGDLLDQRRKITQSGVESYFNHIEIMSNKEEQDYKQLLDTLHCLPENFLMVGNSLKSDILPVLALGGAAIHIPYHTIWQHEHHHEEVIHNRYRKLEHIRQLQTAVH